MESKFIPVRGNPSSPTKNTDYPFWVIGIFLCMEDGVEVYPRQGKSIFPHQKYQLPFWVIGIFLCREDGVEVYPRQGKSIFPHQKYRLSFWTVGIFLCPPKILACFAGQLFNQLRRMHIAPGKPPNKIANPPPVRSADGFFVRLRSRLHLGTQPLRQLPARQAAHQRIETVGAHRQPAMRTRP